MLGLNVLRTMNTWVAEFLANQMPLNGLCMLLELGLLAEIDFDKN
jgi:hypothetical protein